MLEIYEAKLEKITSDKKNLKKIMDVENCLNKLNYQQSFTISNFNIFKTQKINAYFNIRCLHCMCCNTLYNFLFNFFIFMMWDKEKQVMK